MAARRLTRRSVEAAIACLTAVTLAASATPPAGASAPQRIEVDESETFTFPLCGIDTLVSLHDVGTLTIRDRGAAGIDYFAERLARVATNTNLATGRSVRVTQNFFGRDQRIVDNPDGTLTIIWRVTFNETVYRPDGSVAYRTAGQDTVRVVVDDGGTPGDPEDDVVLSEDYLGFTGHDGLEGTDFCEFYTAATA